MKITVDSQVLASAVGWGSNGVSTRPTLPTLAGIRLEAENDVVSVTGYDLDKAFVADVPIGGNVHEAGVVVVSGKLFTDIVRSLPQAPVSLTVEDNRLKVVCGRSKFGLPILPEGEFPELPDVPEKSFDVDKASFHQAVKQVSSAVGSSESLPVLAGVNVAVVDGVMKLAATDRYRLAVRSIPVDANSVGDASFTLQGKALADFTKTKTDADVVSIHVTDERNRVSLEDSDFLATVRTLDGDFPKYAQLIPSEFSTTVVFDVAELAAAVKRVQLVLEMNASLTLQVDGDVITVSSGDSDATGSETVQCETTGDNVTAKFNPSYVLGGLSTLDDDEGLFLFTSPTSPACLRPASSPEDYTYLIMPVR